MKFLYRVGHAHDDPPIRRCIAVRPQGPHRRELARHRAQSSKTPTPRIRRTRCASRIRSARFRRSSSTTASALYDSRVIVDYLDHKAGGGKIIPREPKARFDALRLQALADGMTDAQILVVYEGRWRQPEKHEPKWVDYQSEKIKRGLAVLEADPPGTRSDPERRADRARLPARPSRPALRRRLARGPSEARGLARPLRRAGAGVRRHQDHRLTRRC